MFWFIILFPILIYPWGFDPYYTFPKTAYLQIFVLVTWLYIFIKRKSLFIKITKHDLLPEKIIFILFLLVGVSTIFSVDRMTSIYGVMDRKEGIFTLFSYFSVFLFSTWLLDDKKLDKILPSIAYISIIVSGYGILQHYSLDFLQRNSLKLKYNSTYSFFDNQNFFASYLVLIILITISLFLSEKSKNYATLYFFTVCIAFVSLIFSNTRSGYLGIFFSFVFITFFVIYKRKYLWKKWGILIVSLSLLLLIINLSENGQYTNRINSVVTDSYKVVSNQSTGHEGSARIFIWVNSLPLVLDFFWIGSGPDTFGLVFPDDKEIIDFTGGALVDKAHNEYLQMAITMGVPTLLTYLLFVLIVLIRAFKAVKRAKGNEKIILYGLISAIFGYLVQAFFNISVVPVAPLFWALLGITLNKSRNIMKTE